ncbi:unnamed protein product [Toxocara canis]|uniref:Aa_trans domain-containing protein n=1 Tax=Toxocara canis TaxID=6265 RepID=A0A183VAF7_TOXCA|nr:unnamed protein product [Toxocara canis]
MFRNTRGEERVDPNESVRPNRFQQISKIALKRQNGIRNGYSELRYGDVAYEACSNSFVWLQSWNRALKTFTNAMLVLLQMGVCCVSYVFIAAHLQQEICKILLAISFMSNRLVIMFRCLQELITAPHVTSELPWITNFNGIISAAGSILYSFEGQAMVLPLENKLKHSEDMVGATGVLTTGMSLVTIVYAASGFFGYITFGETVRGSIALNLPDTL